MVLLHLFHNQGRGRPIGGGQSYAQKVLGYNPIAYWPLWETSGGVAYDISGNGFHGAYTGVTLGQVITDANGVTFTCPLFDGLNDFVDVFSAGFRDAFDGTKGTVAIWARMFNIGVWTDGSHRRMFIFQVDGNNWVSFTKWNANNQMKLNYRAGGVSSDLDEAPVSDTNFMHLAITWSASDDEVKTYYRGLQSGPTINGLGVWAGVFTTAYIGSLNNTPTQVTHGWLAQPAVFDEVLTPADIADLAVV